MGQRITFRERASNGAVSDGGTHPAVSIVEQRVKFIKGWLTGGTDPGDGSVECGDGMEFPLKVTLAELVEMFYRVKDARFAAGLAHSADNSGNVAELHFTADDPNVNYFAQADEDVGGANEHHVIVQRSYVDGSLANLTEENQIWNEQHTAPSFPTLGSWTFSTGFTHYAELSIPGGSSFNITGPPAHYSPYGKYSPGGTTCGIAKIELGFTGRVGVVNTAADGNFSPFHSGNELWVEMRFVSQAYDGIIGTYDVYALSFDDGSGAQISGVELSFVMQSGTPTCKLYGRSTDTHGGSGYILTATEWWPYATKAGLPAWNTSTGAPANGGPGA